MFASIMRGTKISLRKTADVVFLYLYQKGGRKLSKLMLKQQRFADEYIICGNATESAKKAGYSEKTARSIGQRLLTNVDIREYLQKRMEELQDEKILTQKQILVMLSEIASGQATETAVVTTKVGVLKEDPISGKSVKVYDEIPQLVEYPTKNSDRNKALELLGKRYAMWTDKQEVSANVSTNKLDNILAQLEGDSS